MKNTVKLKRLLKKKSQGDQFVEASICLMVLMICFMALVMAYNVWMREYSIIDKVGLIQTSYMKRMEVTGYLSADDVVSLRNELTEAGMKADSVFINGSTNGEAPIKYGQPIFLTIKGSVDLSDASCGSNSIASTVKLIQNKFSLSGFGTFEYEKKVTGTSKF